MPIVRKDDSLELQLKTASATVHLYGATVTSWIVDGLDRFFVSSKAFLDGSRPIRGGIPIVFPVFCTSQSPHPTSKLPQHGVARSSYWKNVKTSVETDEEITVQLELDSSEIPDDMRSKWGNQFHLSYAVSLFGSALRTELQIINSSNVETLDFQVLLHTYFHVPDSSHLLIRGLESSSFYDKTADGKKTNLNGPFSGVNKEVDYVFENTVNSFLLDYGDSSFDTLKITKKNFLDTVVWNPWSEKAKLIPDFGDEEYKKMICIEVGTIRQWNSLAPGLSWTGSQLLEIQPKSSKL